MTPDPQPEPAPLRPPRTIGDLERLLEHLGDQISMWTPDLRLIYANTASAPWVTARRAVVPGMRMSEIVDPDVAELAEPFIDTAREVGTVRYPRVLPSPDGSRRTFSMVVRALVTDGTLEGFVVHGMDVTDLAATWDSRGNPAVFASLIAERERIGAELDGHVRPELRRIVDDLSSTEVRTEGYAAQADAAITAIDSVIAELRDLIRALRMAETVVPDFDLPELPRRELRQAMPTPGRVPRGGADPREHPWTLDEALAYVDELPPISAWDDRMLNVFANRRALRGMGAESREQIAGKPHATIVGPAMRDRIGPRARAALAGEDQRFHTTFRDALGRLRTAQFVYRGVRIDGRPVGVVAQLIDVDPYGVGAGDPLEMLSTDRRRIAEDLHDHVIQHLYAAGLAIEGSVLAGDPSALAGHALESIAQAENALRATLRDHGPGGEDDLGELVQRALERATPLLGFEPRLDLIGDPHLADRAVTGEVVAVLTEALSNVARHAFATDVHVTLATAPGSTRLRVADDGIGLGTTGRSSGLANMASRAERLGGTFRRGDRAPRGTAIDWFVPC